VRKRRRCGRFTWRQWPVEATLDEVEGVGRFVELEIQTDADTLREAQTSLIALAAELGLTNVERRSYLEMLLASR
jgi:adenylate cyclase class 2